MSEQKEQRKEWVFIVAQDVTGKSKFPRGLGFTRYKPYHYSNSDKPHRIVYAKYYLGAESEAVRFGEMVDDKMFTTYVGSMGNTKHYCVTDYTMVLHDITTDTSRQIASTVYDDESQKKCYLYSGVLCSNKLLSEWGIEKGL